MPSPPFLGTRWRAARALADRGRANPERVYQPSAAFGSCSSSRALSPAFSDSYVLSRKDTPAVVARRVVAHDTYSHLSQTHISHGWTLSGLPSSSQQTAPSDLTHPVCTRAYVHLPTCPQLCIHRRSVSFVTAFLFNAQVNQDSPTTLAASCSCRTHLRSQSQILLVTASTISCPSCLWVLRENCHLDQPFHVLRGGCTPLACWRIRTSHSGGSDATTNTLVSSLEIWDAPHMVLTTHNNACGHVVYQTASRRPCL